VSASVAYFGPEADILLTLGISFEALLLLVELELLTSSNLLYNVGFIPDAHPLGLEIQAHNQEEAS
jgi:hypothetical protein